MKSEATAACTAASAKVRFDGLVFSRYLASCWIVAYHFYGQASWTRADPKTAGVNIPLYAKHRLTRLFGWGTFWTQYFFFLSGFVLAMARLNSRRPDDLKPTWRFVAERLTTTYPAYLLALVLMLFDQADQMARMTRYDWLNFGLHLTLQQAWWPQMIYATWSHNGMTAMIHWNTPAWFMSALFFYWLLFKPLYRLMRALPAPSLVPILLALWACSAAAPIDMRLKHVSPTQADHDFYRFNPLMSLHIFAAGIIFARIFVEQNLSGLPYSASAALLGYVAIATTVSVEHITGMEHRGQKYETGTFYFLHNGGLLPLHAMLVSGLCSDRDPLTRFFKRPLLLFIGAISYAQYILQAVVFRLVSQAYRAARIRDPDHYSHYPYAPWTWQLVLPCTLFLSALITHYGLSVPAAAHLRSKLDLLATQWPFSSANSLPPATVSASYGATDSAAALLTPRQGEAGLSKV